MAVKKLVKTNLVVKVGQKERIYFTISIGNAQVGGSVVRWKNSQEMLAKGEVTNLDLGLGEAIRGKTIRITTNVLDVNEQTNGIIVNHYFYNGNPSLFSYGERVNNDGDILQLVTEYNFK